MWLESNKSSGRMAAWVLLSGAMFGARLSSAAGNARVGRRLCICKQGSCSIAHALWHGVGVGVTTLEELARVGGGTFVRAVSPGKDTYHDPLHKF